MLSGESLEVKVNLHLDFGNRICAIGVNGQVGSLVQRGGGVEIVAAQGLSGVLLRGAYDWGERSFVLDEVDAHIPQLLTKGEGGRIVMEVCGVDRPTAQAAIRDARGHVKHAIVMLRRAVSAEEAQRLLGEAGGVIRSVIGDPPPIVT